MTHERSLMAGMTNYTGVSLENIILHIKNWEDGTGHTTQLLTEYEASVRQHYDRLDNPDGIIGYIAHFQRLFRRYSAEFERLRRELPNGVRESHVRSLESLYGSSQSEEELCVQFKRDHIDRALKDETLRFDLIDKIYGESRDRIVDYFDLSNVAQRLDALVGTSLQNEVFQLKPNFHGIGVDFKALFRRCARFFHPRK